MSLSQLGMDLMGLLTFSRCGTDIVITHWGSHRENMEIPQAEGYVIYILGRLPMEDRRNTCMLKIRKEAVYSARLSRKKKRTHSVGKAPTNAGHFKAVVSDGLFRGFGAIRSLGFLNMIGV